MLVLTRKRHEMIQIGEDIQIKVIRTGKGSVKIGVEAPDHVRVLRAELCHAPLPLPKAKLAGELETGSDGYAGVCSDQFPQIG